MTKAPQTAFERNLALSRVTVMLAVGFNAGANLLLIGIFARHGGLELVGHWAWLNAIVMNVLILDLGLTDTLTFRIGRDGLAPTAPMVRRANRNGWGLIAGCVALSAVCFWHSSTRLTAASLAALAATLQLASNWRISVRLGQHQQYWFNFKTMCRVASQSGLALALIIALPEQPDLAISFALLGGGLSEFVFTLWSTRHSKLGHGPCANQKHLFSAAKSFSTTNIMHRAVQPLSVLMIGAVLGHSAVAIFTISLRIPVVINQSISESLRGLLPGLAQAKQTDPQRIVPTLRDALVSQILLLIPLGSIAFIGARPILEAWLGFPNPDLILALRMLLVATVCSGLATPFYWANYALGQERFASYAHLASGVIQILIGGIALILTRDIIIFIAIFAGAQMSTAIAMVAISQKNERLAMRVSMQLSWIRASCVIGIMAAFCALTIYVTALGVNKQNEFIALCILAVTIMALSIFLLKKNFLVAA